MTKVERSMLCDMIENIHNRIANIEEEICSDRIGGGHLRKIVDENKKYINRLIDEFRLDDDGGTEVYIEKPKVLR